MDLFVNIGKVYVLTKLNIYMLIIQVHKLMLNNCQHEKEASEIDRVNGGKTNS
jgi:hypothetical protein